MPLTAQQVESLSDEVSRLYGQAERLLLEKVARQIAQGLDSPTWAERKLVEVQLLLARIRGDLNTLAGQIAQEAARALLAAYNRGQAAALADLAIAQLTASVAAGANPATLDQVRRLIGETVSDLIGSHQRILRSVDDVYRQVVREASAQQLLGVQTRREAAQDALNRWADRGVTGFVDRTGRRWEMRSYAEMSMRSAARRASVEGHTDRLQAQGHDLVFVSDHSQECPQCRPWEGKVLSLSGAPRLDDVPVAGTLDQARAAGLLHPGCVVGDTLVAAPTGVRATDSRWYEGEIVVIDTAFGNQVTITPNHPVLTPEGWVPAGALMEGADIVSHHRDVQSVEAMSPDEHLIEARISDIHGALRESFSMLTVRVPAAAEQFHGDGFPDGDVEVVSTDRLLQHVRHADSLGDRPLLVGGVRLEDFLRGRTLPHFGLGQDSASGGHIGRGDLGGSLLGGHSVPLAPLGGTTVGSIATPNQQATDVLLRDPQRGGHLTLRDAGKVHFDRSLRPGRLLDPGHSAGLARVAALDPGTVQHVVDVGAAGPDHVSQLADAGATSSVALDHVVKIERRDFAGHVYNLQSEGGWYLASSIVVHNCRHTIGAFLPGFTKVPTDTADPQGYADRQRLRYLERGVRAWKRREAVALDDAARRKARAKVRQWRARIREHVESTSAKRQPFRESVGAAR